VALPFSYLGHKLFTFRSSGEYHYELSRFVVAASAGLLISASVPELVVQQWHATPATGYLAACIGVPAVNYMLLRFWVFVGRRTPAPGTASLDPTHGS
jgi:putative flippase GtrA